METTQKRRLLVPINIEALVVGDTTRAKWANLKPDFRLLRLNTFLGQQLESEPFSSVSNLYKPGVHLHWALPDGLTHGTKGSGADLIFPEIPNRWLIVRLWEKGGSDQPNLQSRAWIVESDTITDDEAATSFPRIEPQNSSGYEPVFAGRRFDLNQWPGEQGAARINITALGYGDPAFSAYYPACRSVLGFHDRDLDGLNNVLLTYFIAGWYSSSANDPLSQAVARATEFEIFDVLEGFLAERQWIYPGFTEALKKAKQAESSKADLAEKKQMSERMDKSVSDLKDKQKQAAGPTLDHLQSAQKSMETAKTELQRQISDAEQKQPALENEAKTLAAGIPGEIVCHGLISGIAWQSKDAIYDSGAPSGDVKAAVGNTAVEALAALFKGGLLNDQLVRLLEAFQYDLLTDMEKPGGDDVVEHKIHERAFRPQTHGVRWQISEDEASRTSHAEGEKAPPIPGDIWTLLEGLNARQRKINRLRRQRDSARSQLYAIWYKQVLNTGDDPKVNDADLAQRRSELQKEVDRLTGEIAAVEDLNQRRPKGNEWEQLQASLKSFVPGHELQKLEEPRFWQPNDPVILLAGPAFQHSARHGEDGRYRSDGRLLCRLTGQEVTRIKIKVFSAIKEVEFGGPDWDTWCPPPAQDKARPVELTNLFRESLLLSLDDQKKTRAIAFAAYERNQAGLGTKHAADVARLGDLLLQWLRKNFQDDSSTQEALAQPSASENFSLGGDQAAVPSPLGKKQWQRNPWLPLFLQWQSTWTPSYSDVAHALDNWVLNSTGTAFRWSGDIPDTPEETYEGTVLLSAKASLSFTDRLRQYNLTHQSKSLAELQTTLRSMDILCQNFAGFTESLLTRKQRMELRPLENGANGPGLPFDTVKGIDWLSPLTENKLFPIRAGHLKLEQLRVIDAFGQIFQLDGGALTALFRPANLTGPDLRIRLEPRLSQSSRLNVQWLPADQVGKMTNGDGPSGEFNPVCGWILPNFLDKALMIYDAQGHALGTLQAVKTKSWEEGVGGKGLEIEGFHWIGFPGNKSFFFGPASAANPDPLDPSANPHLRAFVRGLLSLDRQSGEAFSGLLEKINQAISVTGGASFQNPNIALLIGKPLALLRAAIRLEFDGDAAEAQGWADLKKPLVERTRSIQDLSFPVRLGDRRQWNEVWLGDDGLVGFFRDQNYSRFFPAYGLTGRDDSYNQYSVVPQISVTAPLDLTLLMDPSRGLCLTPGVLPRQVFEFPYGQIAETLENKQVIFYSGPVVSPRSVTEKPAIRMPQPSDIYGQWSWTHHPEIQVWRQKEINDTQKEQGYFPEAPLEIAEGWLKLITAPLAIRAFTIKGKTAAAKNENKQGESTQLDEFTVAAGETVILSWTAMGADELELLQGTTSLFKSHRYPLPAQYALRVDQETAFTLVAHARPDQLSDERQPRQESRTIRVKIKQTP